MVELHCVVRAVKTATFAACSSIKEVGRGVEVRVEDELVARIERDGIARVDVRAGVEAAVPVGAAEAAVPAAQRGSCEVHRTRACSTSRDAAVTGVQ